jgi:hypothetical protein
MTHKMGKTNDKMKPYNTCQMKYSIICCLSFLSLESDKERKDIDFLLYTNL